MKKNMGFFHCYASLPYGYKQLFETTEKCFTASEPKILRLFGVFRKQTDVSHEKTLTTFHFTGWLIRMFVMVYYKTLYNWVV